jgi:general secretion pathway protein I
VKHARNRVSTRVPGRGTSRARAFTLIEVLATLVLIGIVLPVAMKGATMAMQAASGARHQAEAATMGEAKLNQMIAEGDYAISGGSGTFAPDFPQYKWTVTSALRDFNVTEVSMVVTWAEQGRDRSVNVSTLIYSSTTNNTTTGGTTQ